MDFSFIPCAFIGIFLLLTLLYELNTSFKFYAKLTLYYTIVFLTTVLTIFPALLRPGDPHNTKYVILIFSTLIKVFGIEIEIKGRENLQFQQPSIIVCNHQSSLDMISMFRVFPIPCTCLVKKELLYTGTFGLCGLLCGLTFIDRMQSNKARATLDKLLKKMKEKNIHLWVFPEGRRHREEGLLPFKKGAFHLAIQGQFPIVPIVFSSYSKFYSRKERRFNTGKITISILPKITTEGLTAENVDELSERVRQVMLKSFNEMVTVESSGSQ